MQSQPITSWVIHSLKYSCLLTYTLTFINTLFLGFSLLNSIFGYLCLNPVLHFNENTNMYLYDNCNHYHYDHDNHQTEFKEVTQQWELLKQRHNSGGNSNLVLQQVIYDMMIYYNRSHKLIIWYKRSYDEYFSTFHWVYSFNNLVIIIVCKFIV